MIEISYLALFEIFRDFVQLVSITVQSLGIHIEAPMKFSFLSISDWVSINFVVTVGIDGKTIMGIQFALLIFCTIYLVSLTIKEIRKHYQVQEIKAMTKFQKYFARGVILVITTIFAPLANSSLNYLSGKKTLEEGNEKNGVFLMSGVSLILLVIVNPIIFYYGIKNTRPQLNSFDTSGGSNIVDTREIYFNQLKKHNNPFKELYSHYSHRGAYYKLIVMLFKFIRMCLLLIDPTPEKNIGAFLALYFADIAVNFGFLYYVFKLEPYHDYRSNRNGLLSMTNQICVIIFNMILLGADLDENDPNYTARIAVSIIQLLTCILVFFIYFLKTAFHGSKFMNKLFKMLFKELSFTSIKRRNVNSFAGAKNRFLNYIYFNPQYYDKEKEIKINVWEEFWRDLIRIEGNLKSPKKIEELLFTCTGNAPPYLVDFKGTVEERLEENTRIMQKIGEESYKEELINNQRPEYEKLKIDIFNYVPPVDAYYKHHLLSTGNGFCKVSFFPFPFTCLLVFDNSSQIIEVKGEEYLKHFVESMKTDEYKRLREYRLMMRALNNQVVFHDHSVQTIRKKKKVNSEGKEEHYFVKATIYYKEGTFYTKSEIPSIHTFPDGSSVDVGKGLICSLYYAQGDGVDSEGDRFTGGSCTLSHSELGINYFNRDAGRIAAIMKDNHNKWYYRVQPTQNQYTAYSLNLIQTINLKFETLSYDFNINILNAPYNVFTDRFQIKQLLQKEKNHLIKNIMTEQMINFDVLYEQIEKFKNNDFSAYLYLVFKDIWTLNQDLPIVKKNADLLNPQFKQKQWKEIFVHKGLRSKVGRGYFSDKLLRNLQKMISRFDDKPQDFINQSDILSAQLDPITKVKTDNEGIAEIEGIADIDVENQRQIEKQPQLQKGISDITKYQAGSTKEFLQSQITLIRQNTHNKEINMKNRRTSIDENIQLNKQQSDQFPDEKLALVKNQSSNIIGGLSQANIALNKNASNDIQQIELNN